MTSEARNGDNLHCLVGLSTRAQNALERLGNPSKEDIRNMHTRKMWVRGAGLQTVQEICKWAGRDFPINPQGVAPSERTKPVTPEQRQAGRYARWLRRHGYTVTEPNAR